MSNREPALRRSEQHTWPLRALMVHICTCLSCRQLNHPCHLRQWQGRQQRLTCRQRQLPQQLRHHPHAIHAGEPGASANCSTGRSAAGATGAGAIAPRDSFHIRRIGLRSLKGRTPNGSLEKGIMFHVAVDGGSRTPSEAINGA